MPAPRTFPHGRARAATAGSGDGAGRPAATRWIAYRRHSTSGSERAIIRHMPYSSSASIVIEAPRTKIWDALTRPELIKQYFFGTNLVTDWTVGSPLFFRGEWSGTSYEDKGTVLSFDPMTGLSRRGP